jgi:hypothetical protein
MSVKEIIGADGKILNEYIPPPPGGNVPQLFAKQILTGTSPAGTYQVIGGSQPAGTILAATATGLQWQAGASISLSRGELITSDGTQVIALPYPGAPADGFRLEVDPDVSNPTGLRWASVTDAIEEEAPMSGEAVAGNPGKLSIAINYAAGATGQGQIPVGINFPTGRRGTLLNRGPVGTCLTVANGDGSQGTGLVWANPPVSSVTTTATGNITVTPTANNYEVVLANPLNATLNPATQNITFTTGNITFNDSSVSNTASLSASGLSVSDSNVATTSCNLTDQALVMNNGAVNMTYNAAGLSKLGSASALTISNGVATGTIALNTDGGTADVTTNCPFKPTSIKDSATTPSTGTANQVLTAGPSGNSLVWVTPTVPPAATLTSVLTAGNVNNSGNNLNMNSKLIQNVSNPSAAGDAANKTYVDSAATGVSRTLTQVLTAGNSAGSSTINMNSNKITSLAAPTDGSDATNKTYVDGRPIPVPYTAQGQIQYAGPTLTPTNLPIGTNGQVLTSNGTTVTWAVPSSISVATAKCATFACSFVGDVPIGNLTPPSPGPSSTFDIPFSAVAQTNSNDASITFALDPNGRLQYTGTGSVVVNVYANISWATQQTQTVFPLPSGPFVPVDFITGAYNSNTNSAVFTLLTNPTQTISYARCATGASNFYNAGAYNSNLSGTFVMSQNDQAGLIAFTNAIFNFSAFPGQLRFLFTASPSIYPISDFSFTATRLS